MKILIINTLYAPYRVGGAETSVQLLAEGLVDRGMHVRVITLGARKAKKQSIRSGVEVIYLPLINIYWPFGAMNQPPAWKRLLWHLIDTYNPAMAKMVGQELDEFKPDVVHTNNLQGFSVAIWPQVKQRGIRLVHTMRDYYLFHPNGKLCKWGGRESMQHDSLSIRLWSWIKRKESDNVDVAVGISQYISKLHKDACFFERARRIHIYNPVEVPSCSQRQFGDTSIGFIGCLTVEKGFDDFCKLAEERAGRDINFVAAGRFLSNPTGKALRLRAEKAGIKLLGFVAVEDFLSEADIIYLPVKWQEPFGRTVVECALAGRTVFTSRRGGVAELFSLFENIYEIEEFERHGKEEIKKTDSERSASVSASLVGLFSQKEVVSKLLSIYVPGRF